MYSQEISSKWRHNYWCFCCERCVIAVLLLLRLSGCSRSAKHLIDQTGSTDVLLKW